MKFTIRSILILTLAVAVISPLLRELVELGRFARANTTVTQSLVEDFGVKPMADNSLRYVAFD